MRRSRSLIVSAAVVAASSIVLGGVPWHSVHADSTSASVWVAKDVSATSNCTIGGYSVDAQGKVTNEPSQPCPAGTVIHVGQVPLAEAQSAHESYVLTGASNASFKQLVSDARAHSRASAPATATSDAITPNTDSCDGGASSHYATTNYTSNFGSNVHLSQRYTFSSDCSSKIGWELALSYLGGPTTVKQGYTLLDDQNCWPYCSSHYWQGANANCAALPYTSTFGGLALSVDRRLVSDDGINHWNSSTQSCWPGEPYDDAAVYW